MAGNDVPRRVERDPSPENLAMYQQVVEDFAPLIQAAVRAEAQGIETHLANAPRVAESAVRVQSFSEAEILVLQAAKENLRRLKEESLAEIDRVIGLMIADLSLKISMQNEGFLNRFLEDFITALKIDFAAHDAQALWIVRALHSYRAARRSRGTAPREETAALDDVLDRFDPLLDKFGTLMEGGRAESSKMSVYPVYINALKKTYPDLASLERDCRVMIARAAPVSGVSRQFQYREFAHKRLIMAQNLVLAQPQLDWASKVRLIVKLYCSVLQDLRLRGVELANPDIEFESSEQRAEFLDENRGDMQKASRLFVMFLTEQVLVLDRNEAEALRVAEPRLGSHMRALLHSFHGLHEETVSSEAGRTFTHQELARRREELRELYHLFFHPDVLAILDSQLKLYLREILPGGADLTEDSDYFMPFIGHFFRGVALPQAVASSLVCRMVFAADSADVASLAGDFGVFIYTCNLAAQQACEVFLAEKLGRRLATASAAERKELEEEFVKTPAFKEIQDLFRKVLRVNTPGAREVFLPERHLSYRVLTSGTLKDLVGLAALLHEIFFADPKNPAYTKALVAPVGFWPSVRAVTLGGAEAGVAPVRMSISNTTYRFLESLVNRLRLLLESRPGEFQQMSAEYQTFVHTFIEEFSHERTQKFWANPEVHRSAIMALTTFGVGMKASVFSLMQSMHHVPPTMPHHGFHHVSEMVRSADASKDGSFIPGHEAVSHRLETVHGGVDAAGTVGDVTGADEMMHERAKEDHLGQFGEDQLDFVRHDTEDPDELRWLLSLLLVAHPVPLLELAPAPVARVVTAEEFAAAELVPVVVQRVPSVTAARVATTTPAAAMTTPAAPEVQAATRRVPSATAVATVFRQAGGKREESAPEVTKPPEQ